MNTPRCATALTLLLAVLAATVQAQSGDQMLSRLASCQDSWLDWKDNPAQVQRFADTLRSRYRQEPKTALFKPTSAQSMLGLPVTGLYPQSVGMGVGFSVDVKATHAVARQAFEQALGQPMQCQRSEGTISCELPLGEKKTALLVTPEQPGSSQTLLGCYYFYAP